MVVEFVGLFCQGLITKGRLVTAMAQVADEASDESESPWSIHERSGSNRSGPGGSVSASGEPECGERGRLGVCGGGG